MAGIGSMETHRFKNDTVTRKRLYVSDSFAHPAKGQLGMWAMMVERYSKPGDTILDPMSGSGATLLAALMGRSVVCVELEAHFVDPMRRSWEKMRNMPMLGYTMGTATIMQGDARHLGDVLADCVVTSPPYEGSLVLEQNGIDESQLKQPYGPNSQFSRPQTYTRPSAIITSPPYEGSEVAQSSDGEANRRFREGTYKGDARRGMGLSKGYTK